MSQSYWPKYQGSRGHAGRPGMDEAKWSKTFRGPSEYIFGWYYETYVYIISLAYWEHPHNIFGGSSSWQTGSRGGRSQIGQNFPRAIRIYIWMILCNIRVHHFLRYWEHPHIYIRLILCTIWHVINCYRVIGGSAPPPSNFAKFWVIYTTAWYQPGPDTIRI